MSPRPEAVENIPDVIAKTMEKAKDLTPVIELRNQCNEKMRRVSDSLNRYLNDASRSLKYAETTGDLFTGWEDYWPKERLVGFFIDGDTDCGDGVSRTSVHPIMQIGKRHFLLAGRDFKKAFAITIDEEEKQATIKDCEPLNGQWEVRRRVGESQDLSRLMLVAEEGLKCPSSGVVFDQSLPKCTQGFLDVITGGALQAMYHDACKYSELHTSVMNRMRTKLSVIDKISEGLRLALE